MSKPHITSWPTATLSLQEVEYVNSVIVLTHLYNPQKAPRATGIVLPDEHAEKAKRWDRAQLRRLRLSDAYNAVIRRRSLL